jgi:hypothetical protein
VPGPAWLKGSGDTTAVSIGTNDTLSFYSTSLMINPIVGAADSGYSCFFTEKIIPSSEGTGVICSFGDSPYQLCYKGNSMFAQNMKNPLDTASIYNMATSRICLNSWQSFYITIRYGNSAFPSAPDQVELLLISKALQAKWASNYWVINIYNASNFDSRIIICNPVSKGISAGGSIDFNGIISDCGSKLGSRRDTSAWKNYFGWSVIDSSSQTFPFINKIIYCPPGYGSGTSISSTATFSGSTTISNGYSVNGSAYVAIDKHIGQSFGIITEMSFNIFDLTAKVGFNYNYSSEESNSFSFSRSVNHEISTNNEDAVITEDRTIQSLLVRRRILSSITDSSSKVDTNKSKNCYFIANIPVAVSEMQPYSISSFIAKFKNNADVMKNFLSLYAKDTATGKLRSDYAYKGTLIDQKHLISKAVYEGGSKTIESSSTSSQKFRWGAGPFAELCVEVMGNGVGGSIEAEFSTSNESTRTSDTTSSISYMYTCPFKWDQIHTDIYEDNLFGSRLYAVDSVTSFTTCPLEKHTQPSVDFKYNLHKPASITVGQKAEYMLDITNISPKSNDLLSKWKPEFNGFKVSDALSSIYQNKITFEPNDIVIPQDSTVSIKIVVSSVPDSKLPLCIWAHFGYREEDGSFVDANWDEITADGATVVKQHLPITKSKEFSLICNQNFIGYNLPNASPVFLRIFDLKGRQVASSVHALKNAGQYRENDLTGHLPAGRYLCTFIAGSFSAQKLLNIVR